jgi:hypothetical protein
VQGKGKSCDRSRPATVDFPPLTPVLRPRPFRAEFMSPHPDSAELRWSVSRSRLHPVPADIIYVIFAVRENIIFVTTRYGERPRKSLSRNGLRSTSACVVYTVYLGLVPDASGASGETARRGLG